MSDFTGTTKQVSDRAREPRRVWLQECMIFLFGLWFLKNISYDVVLALQECESPLKDKKTYKYYNSNQNINTPLRRFNFIKVEW